MCLNTVMLTFCFCVQTILAQPFGGNWDYNHYSLRNPLSQNLLFKDISYTDMLSKGMSSLLFPTNMAFSSMTGIPYSQMLNNANFQPFVNNRFSVPALPRNLAFNQIPALNRISYEPKPFYINYLKGNQARQGFPLSPVQSLTLSNLLGNKPYSGIGFVDQQTHLSGFSLPSTYTLIKNPYFQENIMLNNVQSTPYGNNIRFRDVDFRLKHFGERNCLMPYL